MKRQKAASQVRWHRLNLKAKSIGCADGTKNYMGGNYTVHEVVQELACNKCHKTMHKGDYFTLRGKPKPLPICRECHPFEAYDPWEGKGIRA